LRFELEGLVKPQKVLILLHPGQIPPEKPLKEYSDQELLDYKTEISVMSALRRNRHEVKAIGVQDELKPIREEIENWKPDIVFNLLEEFHGNTAYDQNVASYLELLQIPFTGCNPRGLMLSRGKDLAKKLVSYHRVPTPAFAVFPKGRKIVRPRRLAFPVIIKTLSEDASLGIAQASRVEDGAGLKERVEFIHERIGTAAIAEQFIAGRELYVGVLGNQRLRALTVWELDFGDMADGEAIATEKVKHDAAYQKKHAIKSGPAKDLAPELHAKLKRMAKRIYKTLELDGYARIDFRLSPSSVPYFLEANANPDIAESEEFGQAAKYDKLTYRKMINRILALALERGRKSN
jgi:D-alanine-D-alanine ligase